MEKPPKPTLFDFHGVYMTKYFTANWDNVQNFKARPDDIVIATYPKAGGYICSHFPLFDDFFKRLRVYFWSEKKKPTHLSQEPHGSPASWICCTLGRRLQSVRRLSLFIKEFHFWMSTYPMDPLLTQVILLPHYPDYALQCWAWFHTFRAPN